MCWGAPKTILGFWEQMVGFIGLHVWQYSQTEFIYLWRSTKQNEYCEKAHDDVQRTIPISVLFQRNRLEYVHCSSNWLCQCECSDVKEPSPGEVRCLGFSSHLGAPVLGCSECRLHEGRQLWYTPQHLHKHLGHRERTPISLGMVETYLQLKSPNLSTGFLSSHRSSCLRQHVRNVPLLDLNSLFWGMFLDSALNNTQFFSIFCLFLWVYALTQPLKNHSSNFLAENKVQCVQAIGIS